LSEVQLTAPKDITSKNRRKALRLRTIAPFPNNWLLHFGTTRRDTGSEPPR
jgi:hypothetical protein